jgi:hypothetical protein
MDTNNSNTVPACDKVIFVFLLLVLLIFSTTDLKLAPFPNSLAATLRGFTSYLAVPINSIRG